MRATFPAVALLSAACALSACQTYQGELGRAQKAFEQNDHERALAIFRQLEPDISQLSIPERAQFAYLRGMTDYRIGYKVDARHWFAVAKSLEDGTPGLLPGDWKGRLVEALDELNEGVYGGGMESLSNAKEAAETKNPGGKVKSEDEP